MTRATLRTVVLVHLPTALWADSRDWFEELLREFGVIATQAPGEAGPRQLIEFVSDVRDRMSGFSGDTEDVVTDAIVSGESHVDLTIELPVEAAALARGLWEQVVEAERYCQDGSLLTLQPSAPVRRFIRWYLFEVADQIEGSQPTPWRDSEP